MKADCYLPGRNPLAHWELKNRRRLAVDFGEAWFAPPESVIVNKLLFFKEGGSEKLECSPKAEPEVMRGSGAERRWNSHEKEKTYTGRNHQKAA
jgi:hypothetical protein